MYICKKSIAYEFRLVRLNIIYRKNVNHKSEICISSSFLDDISNVAKKLELILSRLKCRYTCIIHVARNHSHGLGNCIRVFDLFIFI